MKHFHLHKFYINFTQTTYTMYYIIDMNRILLCNRPVWVAKSGFYAGCGHCPVCRLRRRKEWAMRMAHHAVGKSCLFVTLTYDNDHLPANGSLSKWALQKWIKRVRKALPKTTCIKYYICGEYGPKTNRPHYHAIIFGLDLTHRELLYQKWNMCKRHCYKCKLISSADRKAFGYVAGYCAKKLGSKYNQRFIDNNPTKIPEYQLQSSGIAPDLTNLYVSSDGLIRDGEKWVIPPRYYRIKLGITADVYRPLLDQMQHEIDVALDSVPDPDTLQRPIGYYDRLDELRHYHQLLVLEPQKEWRQAV